MKTQNERLLNKLLNKKYVLSDYIVYKMGIPRASARILELKQRGHYITGMYVDKFIFDRFKFKTVKKYAYSIRSFVY